MICSTVALLALLETAAAQDLRLIGSGASFPLPIYSAWFKQFSKQTRELIADCQPKGSAGIQDFINHTVDFAGRDAAMTAEEMAKANGGVALIPIAAGEIVIATICPALSLTFGLRATPIPKSSSAK